MLARLLRTPLPALVLAFSLSYGQTQPDSDSTRSQSIHGTVINSVTHEPVARALVSSRDERFATRTDADGHFEFKLQGASGQENGLIRPGGNPFPGLIARKPGFLEEWNTGARIVATGADDRQFTITMVPESIIEGRIQLPTGEAPDPIEVQLYKRQANEGRPHWMNAGATRTYANGEFRFADLGAGTYKVFTRELLDRDPTITQPNGQLYGYPPVYFPNAGDFESAQAIELSAGKIYQADITISHQPYFRVKLPVVNAGDGSPMEVVVSAQGRRGPGFSLGYTDRAIEGMLPNGTYTVEAFDYGQHQSGWATINIKNGAVSGPALVVAPGGSIPVNLKEEFTSAPNSADANGDVNIWLETADEIDQGVNMHSRKAPGGKSLILEGVQPGKYWVHVSPNRGFVSSITSGQLDLLHEPLIVSRGAVNAPIEVTLRDDYAQVTGSVSGIDPSASASGSQTTATVYCMPTADSSGEFRIIHVAPDGTFDSGQIPTGAYRLLAFDTQQPELEYRNADAMRPYDSKGPLVRLTGGQKERVSLQLIVTSE